MLTIGDRSKHFVVEVMASNNMMNLFGKLEKYNRKDDYGDNKDDMKLSMMMIMLAIALRYNEAYDQA